MIRKVPFCLLALLVGIQFSLSASEKPTPEYREIMLSNSAILLKDVSDHIGKKDYSRLAKDATALTANFGKLETFWASSGDDGAVTFVRQGQLAASDLGSSARAKSDEGIEASRRRLFDTCLGCHRVRALRMPDRTLEINYQRAAANAPPASRSVVDGIGSGLGSAASDGTGGVYGPEPVYGPGPQVVMPRPNNIPKPRYTPEAMRVRAQGTVRVECIVRPNGSCSDIRVVRPVDPVFGLDEQAIENVALWRFEPGTRNGQVVPVVVTIDVQFSVH